MRLVAFDDRGGERLGFVDGDLVIDLAAVDERLPRDLGVFIKGGDAARSAVAAAAAKAPAASRRPLAALRLLMPIRQPGKIVCLGLNYVDHAAEGGHSKPDYPSFFLRCTTSLVAPGEPIHGMSCDIYPSTVDRYISSLRSPNRGSSPAHCS